ncbi:MAG TPA: aspartate/glutamate racemase family protein [Rhizomicrobium sp.]|jgi:aspartate racemase|nr:aspartate/glutamate racemase family protein [Rhizomicrobium sp.]
MKTIGMIGGMSWESTAVYYRVINRETQARLGGVHSAPLLLWSFDFAEIDRLQSAGKWDEAATRMIEVGQRLVEGGAGLLIICCNTMHVIAGQVEKGAGMPLLHIATPLGAAIAAKGLRRVGVLGTKYTMKADFLRTPLARDHDVSVIAPEEDDARETHRIIYEELARGRFLDSSRAFFRGAIRRLAARGAEGVVLGCTELPLLIFADDADIPLFDTAELHALAAVDRALA